MIENCWLLLEKSDETRVSKGIQGYEDETGKSYHYDSNVGNHLRLATGDAILLRKEDEILGTGKISSIDQFPDRKNMRRCPACASTDIRERKTKDPKWRCGDCKEEFEEFVDTYAEVTGYIATIENFSRFEAAPTVKDVKLCASEGEGVDSQLSMIRLDPEKVNALLEGTVQDPLALDDPVPGKGQGFGLSAAQRRAVELRAMELARKLYEDDGWAIIDTSSHSPYDFFATKNSERRYIEVKGTTGKGGSVVLTRGEVLHARKKAKQSALIVVTEIILENIKGNWEGKSGMISHHSDPWKIDSSSLEATQYRYQIG